MILPVNCIRCLELQGTYQVYLFASLLCLAIYTNHPVKCYSDLENFVRLLGSLDSNTSTVVYFNGSVFWKQPGTGLKKIFNYEGYNVNRKIRQSDGTFLSLSREFVVYRDPVASQILQVWMNPVTNQPNEVFYVANDPVNGQFDGPAPSFPLPGRAPAFQIYNSDIVLEYPNPLTPEKYPKYSAGSIYDSVELFAFFANYTLLTSSQSDSIPMTGTWMRKSEFLPWMEMGTTPGDLYYTALAWKCNEGLSCVADDIMEIINRDDPKYKNAPTTDEQPNETSWTVFKKVIDQRRLAGLPDIIIPPVNISTNSKPMTYDVDGRVANVLYNWPLRVNVNGTAWSEIPGQPTIALFDVRGFIGVDFEPLPERNGYRLQLDGAVQYYNHSTGKHFTIFNNPITSQTNNVSAYIPVQVDYVFDRNSLYTLDIPQSKLVGLIGAQSVEDVSRLDGSETWTVNTLNLLFPYEELSKTPQQAKFYGTYAMFQSWPEWMKMGDTPGNIVIKVTLSNGF